MSIIEAVTRLAPCRVTPRLARRFVRAALELEAVEVGVREIVELLTGELVTNVVIHVGGSDGELCLRSSAGAVRVEVTDHDGRLPDQRVPSADADGGRGLLIVDRLAHAWGIDPVPGNGKTIWFEVHCPVP